MTNRRVKTTKRSKSLNIVRTPHGPLPVFGLGDLRDNTIHKALVTKEDGSEGVLFYHPFPIADVLHIYDSARSLKDGDAISSDTISSIAALLANVVCDPSGKLLGTIDDWLRLPGASLLLAFNAITSSNRGDKGQSLEVEGQEGGKDTAEGDVPEGNA